MSSERSRPSTRVAGQTPLVVGTAGHIDHGKTALIRALTGVDTDRLPEEKERGITIELGFAPLDLPNGTRLSVVDVPGHERLVRTMVAGATGIDLVLLVVAADEGVMPQTREHLAICELLGLSRGVVALTKSDLVEGEMADLAQEEVRALLSSSSLAGAPVVRVSATTGAGLTELRKRLEEEAEDAQARTPRAGPPRLPIDRVFTMRGFGTVVTGTLVGGALEVGQAVELLPSRRQARIRGLQTHGRSVDRAEPGARTAANLQGIELPEVTRGDLVSTPDSLAPTRTFDARVHWLAGALPLEERASVELLAGTAERRAWLAPIGRARLAPGDSGFARIHVEGEALALLPGDRFVLRGFTRTEQGGTTVGGGTVLDVAPPHRRRSDPVLQAELDALARRDAATDVRVRVERAGLGGIEQQQLRRETGLDDAQLDGLLEQAGVEVCGRARVCLANRALEDLARRAEASLRAFHEREPLRPGMPKGALRGELPQNVRAEALETVLGRMRDAGQIGIDGDLVRHAAHRGELAGVDRELADRLRAQASAAGLEPPTLREWSQRLGRPVEYLREILAHLERQGRVVHAPGDLWFDREAVETLRQRVIAHLEQHGSIATSAYKQLIGTTRKHAVPLMELFDEERLTLRVENRRVLRGDAERGEHAARTR